MSQNMHLRKFGLIGVILLELLSFSGVGVGVGYFFYTRWGFPWWMLLLFSCLGMVFGFYRVYRISQKEL